MDPDKNQILESVKKYYQKVLFVVFPDGFGTEFVQLKKDLDEISSVIFKFISWIIFSKNNYN